MENSELAAKVEKKPVTPEQAVNYLTHRDRDPVFQVIGEYIHAAETGEFDQKKVLRSIRRHFFADRSKKILQSSLIE